MKNTHNVLRTPLLSILFTLSIVCITPGASLYGQKTAPTPPQDSPRITLPPTPPGGWRFYDNKITLMFYIETETGIKTGTGAGALKKFANWNVSLHANAKNHPDEADATPCLTRPLQFANDDSGLASVAFEDVPFGMFTLRISADENGNNSANAGAAPRTRILFNELVSMIHRTPRAAPAEPPMWAVCTHADRFDKKIQLDMDNMAELGANWSRMEFIWGDIEKSENKFDFSHHNKLWQEGARRGVRFFGLLNTTAKGAETIPGAGWGAPPDLRRWENFCRKTLTHFKGRIRHWEIWNEPDGYAFWHFAPGIERAQHHAAMIKTAVKVAREISPEIEILGPCTTHAGTDYMLAVAEAGGLDGVNIVTAHGRGHPDWIQPFFERILSEKLPAKKFQYWYSEGAQDMRALIANLADVSFAHENLNAPPGFLYVMRDKGTNRASFEHNNGLTKVNGQPKNAYIRYQFLCDSFAGATPLGKVASADGLTAFLFSRDDNNHHNNELAAAGNTIAAIWKRDDRLNREERSEATWRKMLYETAPAKLPAWALAPDTHRFDELGNPFGGDAVNEKIYIIKNVALTPALALEASVRCLDEYREINTVKKSALEFLFTNRTGAERVFELTLDDANTIRFPVKKLRVTVPPHSEVRQAAPFVLTGKPPRTGCYFDAKIQDADEPVAPGAVPLRFGPFIIFNSTDNKLVSLYEAARDGLAWKMPAGGGDVHTARSTGIEREALDHDALSRGSSVALAKNPAAPWKNVPKFSFHWTRPANGWSWMSRRYALEKPVAIPGVPLRFSMDVFMEDNVKNYPVTILLTFRDADGKEIRVEGAEVYWRGWRKWECFLPGFLNHGRIHSVAGGDERRAMEKAPFQFTGFIINLPPPKAIVHFPADAPDAGGFILVDNLRVETCD